MTRAELRDVLAALVFVGFVALGWWAARRRAGAPSRTRVSVFLGYVLGASFAVGITQRELYPFTPWPLAAWLSWEEAAFTRLAVVGADGREYQVDYRAWQPLGVDELLAFMDERFPALDSAGQARAASWLLERVARAAQETRAVGQPLGLDRLLGPFAAPYFHMHPVRWRAAGDAPPLPLRALRYYRDRWNVEERARDDSRVTSELLYEHVAP